MLSEFCKKLEAYLNSDQELQRRLDGFKTFSGVPDGHAKRARSLGASATARAIRCYPFGGASFLGAGEMVGVSVEGESSQDQFAISLENKHFSVKSGPWGQPHLTIELKDNLFWKTILGRYRWLWVFGMDGVKVGHANHLPHSDWVTLLEILVAMQEIVEFDPELWKQIEGRI